MKALIIGCNSFYGSHFIKLLLEKKFKIIGLSRSRIKKKHFLPFNKNNKNFKFFKMDLNKDLKNFKDEITDPKKMPNPFHLLSVFI